MSFAAKFAGRSKACTVFMPACFVKQSKRSLIKAEAFSRKFEFHAVAS